ncbi:MAG: C_GCAxxG_C_C family protein [Clostridia bacterium]|nr:C_GCAxxG_C_C family protein [Clostridia bacterium]
MRETINKHVHDLYWNHDFNCARTMLICLCGFFDVNIEQQTFNAAAGMHGAGRYRAQCGLVEGALMFIGIYFSEKRMPEADIAAICYKFADAFTEKFGSLKCYDLRPGGLNDNDPPHLCEELTCSAVEFTYEFIKKIS